jgi:hypothetical protein
MVSDGDPVGDGCIGSNPDVAPDGDSHGPHGLGPHESVRADLVVKGINSYSAGNAAIVANGDASGATVQGCPGIDADILS